MNGLLDLPQELNGVLGKKFFLATWGVEWGLPEVALKIFLDLKLSQTEVDYFIFVFYFIYLLNKLHIFSNISQNSENHILYYSQDQQNCNIWTTQNAKIKIAFFVYIFAMGTPARYGGVFNWFGG